MKRDDGTVVEEPVYIGFCEHGKARAIIYDDPNHRDDTATFVAQMVKDGYVVQRVAGEEGRAAIQFKCEPCDQRTKAEGPDWRTKQTSLGF